MQPDQTPDNRRGIIAMLVAMVMFSTNDVLTKLARETMGVGQVMALRGAFAMLITFAMIAWFGEVRRLRLAFSPRVVARGTSELVIAVLFILALGQMPLADLNAIMQSTPLLMGLFLSLLGLEKMGWRRWTAMLVGFAGVLLVVRPGGSSFDIYTLAAFGSAAIVAGRDIATRRFAADIPTVLILTASIFMVMLGGGVIAIFEGWSPVSAPALLTLAFAALFVVLGNYAMITAFRNVEIAVVSPFRYSIILWGALGGYFVFGEVPHVSAAIGAVLIVASGIYTVQRERLRARAAQQAAIAE